MKISAFSVRRPVFTVMIALIVILLGLISLVRLPVDLMPDITYPRLSISTNYGNASPEEMERLVTRPIEQALSAVPGVEEVTSVSVEGRSSIGVAFVWGTDLDAAASDIRDRLDRVIPRLPDDAERPVLRKFDLASFPVLIIGGSSRLDPVQMRKLIEDQVKYRIERVPGVAALDIWGGLDREIHVNLHPERIKALGLSLEEIMARIRASNVDLPAGSLDRGPLGVTLRTQGAYLDLEQLRRTVVANRDDSTVELHEVADIDDSWQKVSRIVRVNGQPGIRLSVSKQSGKNTVEVANEVLKELDKINQDLPQISLTPIINSADYIERSIRNVSTSALYGGALAVVVLLVFLRNIRSTAVIATAIPASIVATFAMMYFGGFTLNIMTLGGLALGIGMLVDNAIVVLENIFRLREAGKGAQDAATEGSQEVTSAIIASTLTTMAVFLPLVFMRGMTGVMFKELSLVVAFSLLGSLVVALTLVPMLASKLISKRQRQIPAAADSAPSPQHQPPAASADAGRQPPQRGVLQVLFELSGRALTVLENQYKDLLHVALSHRVLVVIAAMAVLLGSLMLVPLVGVELMPATDGGEVRVSAEMAIGTRVEVVAEAFARAERIIVDEVGSELQQVVLSAGGSPWGAGGSHVADMRIALVPLAERSRSSEEIAVALRKRLANIPGAVIRTRAGSGMPMQRLLGGGGTEQVQVEIRGHDLQVADILAEQVKSALETVAGVTDARISRDTGTPEEVLHIDRLRADDLKVRVRQIAETLQTALSGTTAGFYREGGEEYRILVKLKDAEQRSMQEVMDLSVINTLGEQVVLGNVISARPQEGPVSVERKDQERIITVSANISGRDLGSIMTDVRQLVDAMPRPADFSIVYGGDYESQQESFYELLISFALALVLVYMVMACQYESLRDPFVVMFSVPLAAVGVILMLFLTRTTFNIQSFIGCIMLGGIVVNNAILLVDHTNLLRSRDGLPMREAIEEAGRRRLRPILMTALTTVFGLTPLAIGLGEGGEAQAPMARAVIGGLLSSTLITLVFVPVIYSFVTGRRKYNTVHQSDS